MFFMSSALHLYAALKKMLCLNQRSDTKNVAILQSIHTDHTEVCVTFPCGAGLYIFFSHLSLCLTQVR